MGRGSGDLEQPFASAIPTCGYPVSHHHTWEACLEFRRTRYSREFRKSQRWLDTSIKARAQFWAYGGRELDAAASRGSGYGTQTLSAAQDCRTLPPGGGGNETRGWGQHIRLRRGRALRGGPAAAHLRGSARL